ncbi:PhzF family phenazine biosynthesis protein [Lentiprolixibacter aurantiacus]|uniref:PhzF family phenazine biosynthesis protein n=1 Tax=Lentiprolixibacter aurantiacus TaxID=2993939 RepID=A0AAE3SMF8_9FLAO|nr:PhzF family phenazine biosynthesis protein [Lentiprolixibacter aurantiacus]MCX2718662.1 PhzF family phenazine biosynthesis protein [Lentiprolixibacter aurantiacus]
MKPLKIFQVDAFAERVFTGNPAAVCVLEEWLPDDSMQAIAMENNLAETAFTVKEEKGYHIRWFTPEVEVALCGHATLATAFVLYEYYSFEGNKISFYSEKSGPLAVEKGENGLLTLDFPADTLQEVASDEKLNEALGIVPLKTLKGKTDYLLIYSEEQQVRAMDPNIFLLNQVDARGIIVSAPGVEVDFVSRFFAPQCGVSEDPVTGSAHTTLTPYWSEILNKKILSARQLSRRGGNLSCELRGSRVRISGRVKPYLKGEIHI